MADFTDAAVIAGTDAVLVTALGNDQLVQTSNEAAYLASVDTTALLVAYNDQLAQDFIDTEVALAPTEGPPPEVTGVTPASGSTIAQTASVTFSLEDDVGIDAAVITMVAASIAETVYDGAFGPNYTTSVRTVMSAQLHNYTITRTNGWPSSFVLHVHPVDTDGNTIDEVLTYTVVATSSPAVSAISPASASSISAATPVTFTLGATTGLRVAAVSVAYGSGQPELIWTTSGGFTSKFSSLSTATAWVDGVKSLAFSIARTNGWRPNPVISVLGVNSEGVATTTTLNYTITGGFTEVPVISGFVPAAGTAISRTQAIQFDVLDGNSSLASVTIGAYFAATGADETVIRNGVFRPYYSASTRAAIANGYRYTIRRYSGWPSAPEFFIDAVDTDGNVSS